MQERQAVIVGELVVLLVAETVGERLGVESGVGGQGQHAVVPRVHDDDGANPLAEGALRRLLNIDVQGEDDVLAGLGRLLGDGAGGGALGGDRGQGAAVLAGQDLIELGLQAEGADLVAGAVALHRQLLELFGGDLRHVAQDVGGGITVGVDALSLLPHHYSQVGEGVELVQRLDAGAVGQGGDRDEVVGRKVGLHLCAYVGLGHTEGGGEAGDERLLIGDEVRHEADDRQAGVHRQLLTVAVQDGAAEGGVGEEVD